MTSELNQQISNKLEEAAELLTQQGANPFRITAYRKAAETAASLDRDLGEVAETEGMDGLIALPTIGRGIAAAIWEIVKTGRWSQLERLRGSLDPVALLQTVPGVGQGLAERIHDELHVDTLEQLEVAAYDGRLEHMVGVGPRRLQALRASLGSMLGQARRQRPRQSAVGPAVSVLLEVDQLYRRRAADDDLPLIAPKRFNPSGEAWLPVMHIEMEGWHFTALFSNTARAHQLHKTRDWVVVYFYDRDHEEGQNTVVTETRGPLAGFRIVRGREAECRDHYTAAKPVEVV